MRKVEENKKKDKPILCYVEKGFLKYMHSIDWRISVKYNNRVFAGVVTSIKDKKYVIPLTSQTTKERAKEGKKKRSVLITTFIKDEDGEIANLLYNNMFPVQECFIKRIEIDPLVNTYLAKEIRYIRKKWDDIEEKAKNVYNERYDTSSRNYSFLQKTCCDFKKLEQEYEKYLLSSISEIEAPNNRYS